MDWTHVMGIVLGNAAFVVPMFLWSRAESRADWRHMDAKTDAMRTEFRESLSAIHEEIKDFHGRLCAIEERRIGK